MTKGVPTTPEKSPAYRDGRKFAKDLAVGDDVSIGLIGQAAIEGYTTDADVSDYVDGVLEFFHVHMDGALPVLDQNNIVRGFEGGMNVKFTRALVEGL